MEAKDPPAADTIFAPATPPGRSALAVIRMSGVNAVTALNAIAGRTPEPRMAVLRTLRYPTTRAPIDQALVLYFKGPTTETGEDIVEFQTHGGRAVITALLQALATIPGCRMAEPGEFARRAFHNGKMDLTAVEGLADLIDAETEGQRRQALAQAAGGLARLYEGWRDQLLKAQALTEAGIDFSDEADVADGALSEARSVAVRLSAELTQHLAQAYRGEILRSGFKVVLAGPPNVGKSSLLNALARRDAAIVSDEPGTTRDVIEVRLDLGGIPVVLSDTAGIREPAGAIEREGVRRTMDRVRGADLVLLLQEAGQETSEDLIDPGAHGARDFMLLRSKADLAPGTPIKGDGIAISTTTGEGIEAVVTAIVDRATAGIGDGDDMAPTQARHRQHLERALAHLSTFADGSLDQPELRAEDLRLAAAELGRLTGRIDPEDVLGAIFGRFCIGK